MTWRAAAVAGALVLSGAPASAHAGVSGIGTFANGQSSSSFGADVRNAPLQVTNAVGQSVRVSYTVTCSGTERTAGPSAEASATIEAANTPTPSQSPSASGNGNGNNGNNGNG